jgi:nucleotide-binding universal stress UspA family protein
MAWSPVDGHWAARGPAGYDDRDAALALDLFVSRSLGDEDVGRRVVCDKPVPALVQLGEEASLLVLGPRGAGGFLDLHLGSTTFGVLRRASGPVAVVRGPGGEGSVVVGVDGSPGADAALRWAVEETRWRGGALEVIIAWQRPALAAWALSRTAPYTEEMTAEAEHLLEEALARVDTSGITIIRTVVEGSPAGALLAGSRSASVLVVGTRGRGAVAEAVLGSVSHQVVDHSLGPVVVVPDAA